MRDFPSWHPELGCALARGEPHRQRVGCTFPETLGAQTPVRVAGQRADAGERLRLNVSSLPKPEVTLWQVNSIHS